MRSKAQFMGHPLHPILIAFPIAFLCGGLGFDVAGWAGHWPSAWTTGGYLSIAAVLSGLVAAVPGLIDYLYIIPPNSSARRRGTWHLVVNVVALTVSTLGWVFRDVASWQPGAGTLLLEAAGVAFVGCGGWLGGTLVYRNQIAVDHRYAEAGTWQEHTVEGRPGEAVCVARTNELKPDQMKLLHVAGRRIVLARTGEGYLAFDDRCTHRGASLADGTLTCGTVCCPWHGSQFDVRSGAVHAGPAKTVIRTYRVETVGEEVRLTVPGEAG